MIGRLGVTRGEALLGLLYAAVSFAILGALVSTGHDLTGGENAVAADQLQYLSWIESASRNWTIDSLWSIPAQTGSAFLHPGFLISGLLHRAGLGVIASFQVWKPLSIIAIVWSFIAYVRRLVPAGGARTAALALALFGLSPAGALVGWGRLSSGHGLASQLEFAAGEVFAASWQWGYMMTALAVAAMVAALLLSEAVIAEGARRRAVVTAALAALACSWLQPWQGAELIAALVVCDLARPGARGRRASLAAHLPVLVAGVLPLAYYRWLAATEDVWKLAGSANNGIPNWSVSTWLLTFAIWLPAVAACRRRNLDWQQLAVRVVPLLMVAQYAAIALIGQGTFPFHAIQGVGLFLGILSVEGMLALRGVDWWGARPWLAGLLVVGACLPGTAHRLNLLRLEIHRSAQPFFLEPGERQVLDRLAAADDGTGVLAPIKAALSVPGHTGHPVWVGEISWTPDFRHRVAVAERFFSLGMPSDRMQALVRDSGVRWVYVDCGHADGAKVRAALGPLVTGSERFGCAELIGVDGGRS